jgi:hypothetical protein
MNSNNDSFSNLSLGGNLGKLSKVENGGDIFVLIINTIFVLGIALGLLFIIIGGIKIATSAGDQQKLSEGKDTVTWAVIGFIVVVGFRGIINLVLTTLGLEGLG